MERLPPVNHSGRISGMFTEVRHLRHQGVVVLVSRGGAVHMRIFGDGPPEAHWAAAALEGVCQVIRFG